MLGLSLQGVPLGGIPLGGIPLGGIPLGGIPLGGILVGTPLGGIPLGGINLLGTPLGGIPLGGIDMSPSASPLGGIPLGGIPVSAKNAILVCPTGTFVCANTDTLGAAQAAGAIRPTALLQDLGYYKNASGQDITLAELVRGLPPSTTLEDLLGTVLLKVAYDWEALPLPGFPLQDFSTDGGVVTYTVPFTVEGIGPRVGGQVGVSMPAGARYVPGSTLLSGGAGIATGEPTLSSPQNRLTWTITGIQLGTPYTLTFRAKPGLSLGTESASAQIVATGLNGTVLGPSAATTLITEPGEPANGDPSTAPPIQDGTLYLGYTSSGSDRDFFQIQASPGEQLTIHLSHLDVDDDLVVYGPDIVPLRTPHAGTTAPFVGDVPFVLGQRTQSITPEALRDVPQNAAGQPALDVSDNRGLADEEVAVVSPDGGTYTIQVSSFDGDYSNEPWQLRVERAAAIPLPSTCTNPPATGGGVTKPMPPVPANASTLYLFASKRFGDLYGLQAENDVWNGLQTLAARTDAAGGAVIPVDANAAVLSALNARAADPCSAAKANDVVRAVGTLLDNPQIVTPSVKYIVVVGDDAAGIPFGRILDNTAFANERGYTSTFYGNANNQYLSTYARGFLPTDDPLGDVNYTGTGPYVPELAVGRLVEKPTDILAQINQYVTRNGAITQAKALTTGYDFLSDGASRISAGFATRLGQANAQALINDTWSKFDAAERDVPADEPAADHLDQRPLRPLPRAAGRRERSPARVDSPHVGRPGGPLDERARGLHHGVPLGTPGVRLRRRQSAQRGLVADVRPGRRHRLHGQHRLRARRHRRRAVLGEAERALRRQARRLDDRRPGACVREAGVRGDADPERLPPEGDRPGDDDGPPDVPRGQRGSSGPAAAGDDDDRFGDRAAERVVQRHPELHQGRHRDRQLLRLGRLVRREPPPDRAHDQARHHAAGPRRARCPDHRPHFRRPDRVQRSLQPGRRGPLGVQPRARRRRHLPDEAPVDRDGRDADRHPPATGALHRTVPERRDPRSAGHRHTAAIHVAGGHGFLHAGQHQRFQSAELRPGEGVAGRRQRRLRRRHHRQRRRGQREARAHALQGRERALEEDRDVAELVAVDRGRPTRRDRGRMVHPGGRRIGQRGGHEQQVSRQVRQRGAADRHDRGAAERPADERLVHGQRAGDDQRRAGHLLQPRRGPVHPRHVARHQRNGRPHARLPGHGRLPAVRWTYRSTPPAPRWR